MAGILIGKRGVVHVGNFKDAQGKPAAVDADHPVIDLVLDDPALAQFQAIDGTALAGGADSPLDFAVLVSGAGANGLSITLDGRPGTGQAPFTLRGTWDGLADATTGTVDVTPEP